MTRRAILRPKQGGLRRLIAVTAAAALMVLGVVDASPAFSAVPTYSQVATIPTGTFTTYVALNSTTGTLYAVNQLDNTVSVINTATNAVVTTIPVGASPVGVAVNPVTNRAYVANNGNSTLSVIDGATNTVTATVPLGVFPQAVAVNPVTNTIYVTGGPSRTVLVIDGATNTITNTITLPSSSGKIAVNPATNTVYVYESAITTVAVIDGATNTITTSILISVSGSGGLAVNPTNNTLYVGAGASNSLVVIDGGANTVTTTIPLGTAGGEVGVDTGNGAVFVSNATSGALARVVVVDGATNTVAQSVPVSDDSHGIAVNSITHTTYVAAAVVAGVVQVLASASAPLITSPAPPPAVTGEPYSFTVQASGSGPLTYSISAGALPPGLSLDPTSGVISGTPTASGSFGFTVTVSNAAGSDSKAYTVPVDPPAPAAAPSNGTHVVGTGEPGNTITVKDPNGTTIGTGTVAVDGSFDVPLSPAQPDGTVLSVTQTDPTGNTSAPATSTVDAVAPAAPLVDPTNGTQVSGTGEPGDTVTVKDPNGTTIGTGTVAPDGSFTIPLSPTQPDGTVLTVTQTDPAGNVSPPTTVTVDATAPPAPLVDPTNGTQVNGTGEPGDTITVKDPNGTTIGTGTVAPDGSFTIPLSPTQPDGTILTVTQTDPAGNVSPPTTVTVDATAPAAPLVDPTNGTQVSGTGEPGDTIMVKDPNGTTIGTGTVAPDGSFTIPLSPTQPDGTILSVTQTDPAGNVSPPTTVTVVATAPPAPLVDPTNGTQVSGTGEPGDTIVVKDPNGTTIGTGTVAPDGSFTIPLSPTQSDGVILSVTQTDPAGNVSPPTTVTVDAAAPAAPFVDPTNGTQVSGTGEPGDTVVVKDPNGTTIGAGTVAPDGSFTIPLSPTQPDGTVLSVTQTDPAGNVSPPTTVTVDATAPAAPVVDPSNGVHVSGMGEPGDTVVVKDPNGTTIGTGTVAPDGTFDIPLSPAQPDGTILSVTQTDPAGNVSPPTTVTVDATAPAAPLVNPTNGTHVSGTGEPGDIIVVKDPIGTTIGTGLVAPDGSFDVPLSPTQPDGTILSVTQTDPAGNVSPPATVTVDATAPAAPLVDPTNGTQVSGTGEPGDTVVVKDPNGTTIGTGVVAPDGSFTIPLSPTQPDGAILTVTQTDPAGNVSPPATVTVDATAPAAPVVDPSNGTQVSGTGQAGDTITVKDPNGTTIGTGVVAPDGSFTIPLSPAQPDGTVLTVTETDPAGNVSPPTTVTVDATAPAAPLVDPTNGTQVSGTGEPGDTITVKDPNGTTIGTGTVAPDGTFTVPLSPTQPNGAILSVTQTDPAGNVSPPTTVTVDAAAPAAPVVDPTDGTHVSGSGEPGGTVTIKDPNGTTIGTGLVAPDGTFDIPLNPTQPNGTDLSVTVTDPVGNVSPPTTVTVDSAAPAAPVVDPTNGTQVSGTGEPGDTIVVKDSNGTTIGTGTVGPDGTFTIPLNPVQPDGSVLTVTATDPAGNVSPPTTVTVDAVAPSAPVVDPTNGFHVTGTGQPGATVTITDPAGAVVGTGTVGPDGRFDVTLTPAQADKTVLTVTQTDAAGNVSPSAGVTVDRPAVTPPGSILCAENANGTVTCSGTGKPGDTISITDGTGGPVCSTTITAARTWSCTSSGPVTARPLTITVTTPAGDTLTVSGIGVTPYAAPVGGAMGDLASTGSNVASAVVGMLFLLTIGGGLVAIGRHRRRRLQR